jgi:hypothetical protein
MSDVLTQLGVGGILVVLVLREVFNFLAKRNGEKGDAHPHECVECRKMVEQLFKMHDKTDEDGVYVWYVRKSLEAAISKLGDAIETQTQVFRNLLVHMEEKQRSGDD